MNHGRFVKASARFFGEPKRRASMGITGLDEDVESRIHDAASLIRSARYLTAFTGADISVESGIPPFRGPGGLWTQYDPRMLEIEFFLHHPDQAWPVIREIFYEHFGAAKPHAALLGLARLEAACLFGVGLRFSVAQNRERETRSPKMFCAMPFRSDALLLNAHPGDLYVLDELFLGNLGQF
jgi:hypothetical protein